MLEAFLHGRLPCPLLAALRIIRQLGGVGQSFDDGSRLLKNPALLIGEISALGDRAQGIDDIAISEVLLLLGFSSVAPGLPCDQFRDLKLGQLIVSADLDSPLATAPYPGPVITGPGTSVSRAFQVHETSAFGTRRDAVRHGRGPPLPWQAKPCSANAQARTPWREGASPH